MREQRTRLPVRVAECRGCGDTIERRGRDRFGWCDVCRGVAVELIELKGAAHSLRGTAFGSAEASRRPPAFVSTADMLDRVAAEIQRQLRERDGDVWEYAAGLVRVVDAPRDDGGGIVILARYRAGVSR